MTVQPHCKENVIIIKLSKTIDPTVFYRGVVET